MIMICFKNYEADVEHLTEEKKQLTIQLRSCKAQLQETVNKHLTILGNFYFINRWVNSINTSRSFKTRLATYNSYMCWWFSEQQVDEVKEQCDNTINQLTIENTDLRWVYCSYVMIYIRISLHCRKRLVKKTEELSDLRMEEERRLRNVQFNLKKVNSVAKPAKYQFNH